MRLRVVISFDLNSVADDCTIGAFAIVLISGGLYFAGVIRPVKADAEWWATAHQELGKVVVVDAILESRTRNPKTVFDAALAEDPGWPRRIRARFHRPKFTRFYIPDPVPEGYSPAVPDGGLAIPGRGAAGFKDLLRKEALPYTRTRFWVQVGKSNFYFKLRQRQT